MRCFIALPIADELRDLMLEAWARVDKPTCDIKFVAEDQWHATLAFLGNVDDRRIREIIHACSRATACPGIIAFNTLESFPSISPHLIVASGMPEPLGAWRQWIDHLRAQCKNAAPDIDMKPWRPHITIAKAPRNNVLPRWSRAIGPWTWQPGGFVLNESRLGRERSEYRVIHEFPFAH